MQMLAGALFLTAAAALYYIPGASDSLFGDLKTYSFDVGDILAAVVAAPPVIAGVFLAFEGWSRNGTTVYPRGPGEKNDMA